MVQYSGDGASLKRPNITGLCALATSASTPLEVSHIRIPAFRFLSPDSCIPCRVWLRIVVPFSDAAVVCCQVMKKLQDAYGGNPPNKVCAECVLCRVLLTWYV